MSRSNPTERIANPAERWFEWDGANGVVRHYDKEKKENITVSGKFTFLLLDELATIKGWHDDSDSGIYSNEVRDTTQEAFVVKAFKAKHPIAQGTYRSIRDAVAAAGGHFTANLYIAFRDGDTLRIGSIQFKGAALNAWVELKNNNRKAIYQKAIVITGFTEGKKGKVVFRSPTFELKEIKPETDEEAKRLDQQLQDFLKAYFNKPKAEAAAPHPQNEEEFSQDREEAEPSPEKLRGTAQKPDDDKPAEDDIPW